MKKLKLAIFFALFHLSLFSQNSFNSPKMDWWKEARFGMFIHWGLYALPAGVWEGKDVPGIGEWIMLRGKIPTQDYQQLATKFNPVQFNADAWVKLAKDVGMKYIIITSKHHDGFAMFKSKDPFNIVDATPYKKDPIAAIAEACKKYKIKFGLYYSQAQDWNHSGGAAASGGHWDLRQNGDMDKYIDDVAVPQVKEILSAYDPAIIWWDTPIDMNKSRADKIAAVLKSNPNLITNNRLGGDYDGDLETPEQYIPATGILGKNWESCMTMNNTWGFKSKDNAWKSTEVIIRNLVDIASKGGNYLLNVGPTAEGIIPQPSVERLQEVGKWLKVYGEAIYGTTASPFAYLPWGRCTQKQNKLYLHVFNWPTDGILKLPLGNKDLIGAYLLADKKVKVKINQITGSKYLSIHLPNNAPNKIASVVVLNLKSKPILTIEDPIPSLKKMATASSQKSDATKPSLAFDGNGRKGWIAADANKTAWLAVDIGKPTSIGSIAMTEAGMFDKYIQRFEFQYKQGDDWKTIYEGKTIGAGYFKTFKPVLGQEFRINILECSKEPQLKEVQLYFDE
jgi:alpha-L-fucosidase